ncbi:amidohydrolase [Mesosutterella sp. OilRF-GAM-744-9]|uniref:Amidohydrolase n=1 Tax=Mesosutterella porci TaxID=2915351 RepID=A0ABS9MPS7_9BURK|nr:amidohydrolase [Mesosutterella sp. oilRF-744-WT-GAM-9]MCG5030625.1 amidohydrolase [Mesosutterella sp. oilRF-744-WT-GAM-9]
MEFVLKDKVFPEIAAWADELAAIRHEIHENPELGFETPKTAERIAGLLRGWGADEIDQKTVRNGVIAVVNGSRPGPALALRADIDALPIDDLSGRPWASRIKGRCHACGHDGHQTWLLGALRHLATDRSFAGRVIGIFQPCEEPTGGAKAVVDSGVFQKYGIREIYGAHDEPMLPKGVFGFRAGPLQASSDNFWIKIHGRGTHGGRPHLGIDPIAAGVQLYGALLSIVSRRVDPIEPAVVSVCSLNAGRYEAQNVVPPLLTMSGTVRTYSEEVRSQIEREVQLMTEETARANGCSSEIRYERKTPAVINDRDRTLEAAGIAQKLFGGEHVVPDMKPFMSSEDFAEYQRVVPGVMIRIGIRDEDHTAGVHSPVFDFNDEVLPAAATLLSKIARVRLEELAAADA